MTGNITAALALFTGYTTHAYLEEEQQKLEGITATQIVGLSIRQNELN